MGSSFPSSILGRNFSPAQIPELPGMGGERRNIFLTVPWKDSVVLCCIPAGNHRASTRQTPDSTRCSSSDGNKIPAQSSALVPRPFHGVTVGWKPPSAEPRPVPGNLQRCWSQQRNAQLSPHCQSCCQHCLCHSTTHSMARAWRRLQTPPFILVSLFSCLLEDFS